MTARARLAARASKTFHFCKSKMEGAVIARKRKTQKKKQKVIFTLITLLSSLITSFNLNLMLLNLNDDIFCKRRRKLLSTLTLSMPILRAKSSRKTPVGRRFWEDFRTVFSVTPADPCKQEKRQENDGANVFRSHRKRYRFQ